MRFCLLLLIPAAVAVAAIGCGQVKDRQKPARRTGPRTGPQIAASQKPIAHDEPPLLLDDEPLLLLDDNSSIDSSAGPVADNSRCHVCHINYAEEEIALVHAKANIGCADCHGDSDAHIADESWSWGENGTAPDIMYPPEKINSSCMGCHPKGEIATEDHKPLFAGQAEKKYCTDCHGDHRLAERKCKWK